MCAPSPYMLTATGGVSSSSGVSEMPPVCEYLSKRYAFFVSHVDVPEQGQ